MLTNDMDKLVSNTLNGNEQLNKKHDEEIQKYKKNEEELNCQIKKVMEEKAGLLKEIEKLNGKNILIIFNIIFIFCLMIINIFIFLLFYYY